MNRTAVSAIAVLAAIAASTPSAVASVADESKPSASTSSPESISDQDFAGSEGVGRYVLADSPSEANRVLDRLDSGQLSAASVRYGPCTLHPSPIRKRNGYVRTKPHTKCTVSVTSIRHSTDLRYKSFIWWKLKGTKTASNRGVASLQQKNAQFKCVSSEKSGWGSTTAGTIVYRGKTYYARVYPARVSLSCGG